MEEVGAEPYPGWRPVEEYCGVLRAPPGNPSAKDTTLRQTVYIKVWTAYIRPHYKGRPDLASIGLDSAGFI